MKLRKAPESSRWIAVVATVGMLLGAGVVLGVGGEPTMSAASATSFVPLSPSRVLDTRSTAKVGAADGTGAALTVNVFNKAGLPGSGIGAVALNVTVTDTTNPNVGGGYITVYPCGTRPDASNLNFTAGQTVANSVIAPVSPTGDICFYVYGTANLLADVSGYFPAFTPPPPTTTSPTTTVAIQPLRVLICDEDANGYWQEWSSGPPGFPGGNIPVPVDDISQVFTVEGGVPPYSYSATGLEGYALSMVGALTYVDAPVGTELFTLRVSDSSSQFVELPGSITHKTGGILPGTC